jgi:hypothetical protein
MRLLVKVITATFLILKNCGRLQPYCIFQRDVNHRHADFYQAVLVGRGNLLENHFTFK